MSRPNEEKLPLTPDSRFGGSDGKRFLVEKEAGRGGQAVVFRATDTRLSRRVAVKVCIAPAGNVRRLFMQRFERELRLTSRVDHPHVLQIHDCGELPGGFPFVLLEWMGHGSLTGIVDRLAKRGRLLPMSYVSYYARAIGAALRATHAADVVHRDIKPDNILLSRDGVAKITDFGIARDLAPGAVALTDRGDTPGTPGFMAPEHLAGRPGPLSDIFSLGVTLYVTLTGTMLPQEASRGRMPSGVALEEGWRAVPERIAPLFRRLCAARMEDRPQSMRAALEMIEAADWSEAPRPLPVPGQLPPLPSSVFVTGSTSAHEVAAVTDSSMSSVAWQKVAATNPMVTPLYDADTVDLPSANVRPVSTPDRSTGARAPTVAPPKRPPVKTSRSPVLPESSAGKGWPKAALPVLTGLIGLLLGGLLMVLLRSGEPPTPAVGPAPTEAAEEPATGEQPAVQQPEPGSGVRSDPVEATPAPRSGPSAATPAPRSGPSAATAGAGASDATTPAGQPVEATPEARPEPVMVAVAEPAAGDRCAGIDVADLRSLPGLTGAQVACLEDTAHGRRAASDPDTQEAAITLFNRRASGWPAAVEAALARPALANAPALAFAGVKPAYDSGRYGAVVRRAGTVWVNLDKGYDLSSKDVSYVAEFACRSSAQLALSGGDEEEGITWCERWYELAEQTGASTAPIQDLLDRLE